MIGKSENSQDFGIRSIFSQESGIKHPSGGPLLWEKIVWFFVQLACLAAVIYFTNGFYTKYHRFEVRTEIQCTGDIVFPTATMCDDFSSIILSKIAIRTKHWKREERAQNMISLTTKCIQDTKTSHPLLHHIP